MAVKRAAPGQHVPSPKARRNAVVKPEVPPVPAEPSRSDAPRGIAGLLAHVVRPAFRKRAPAAAQLLADWPMLAGPDLAARATPVKFAAGTLTLACIGPVAMELQLLAPAVIERLNLGLGSRMVERLRFVQQAPAVLKPERARPRHPAAAAPPPEDLPDGELGQALARLHQGIHRKD